MSPRPLPVPTYSHLLLQVLKRQQFEAVAGHQDVVTRSPVSAKLRPSQEGEQLCGTAMHEPQQKDLLSL